MSRIAYVNRRYVPVAEAMVHVEDRGYQFSDGVYEVCEIRSGHILEVTWHLDRLERSLRELQISMPITRRVLPRIFQEIARRNRVRNGLIYLQATRGVWRRDHAFPPDHVRSALVIMARIGDLAKADQLAESGVGVLTVPENRWDRVDVKSVSLLPNILAKQQAKSAGCGEAWFVDSEGLVTEGSSTNAWIVDRDGVLVTRPAESGILKGITRMRIQLMAKARGIVFEERAFSVEDVRSAREAFMTAATSVVMPVVSIDGNPVANGHPGEIALSLRHGMLDAAEKLAIY